MPQMPQVRECRIQDLQPNFIAMIQKAIPKDEKILLCYEWYDEGSKGTINPLVVHIITERQLLTCTEYAVRSEPLDRFLSVSRGYGTIDGGYFVQIFGGEKFYFAERKDLADHFFSALEQASKLSTAARYKLPAEAKSASKDIADQLMKLIELRKNNLITEDEFNAAKKKLLE